MRSTFFAQRLRQRRFASFPRTGPSDEATWLTTSAAFGLSTTRPTPSHCQRRNIQRNWPRIAARLQEKMKENPLCCVRSARGQRDPADRSDGRMRTQTKPHERSRQCTTKPCTHHEAHCHVLPVFGHRIFRRRDALSALPPTCVAPQVTLMLQTSSDVHSKLPQF